MRFHLSILTSLRKGFGFFLNSMGVSTYAKKPAVIVPPPASAAPRPIKPN